MYAAKKHAFKIFNEKLKKDSLENVIYLHGTEGYLISWALESIVKRYVSPQARDFDYIRLDSEIESIDEIIGACETFSMFSQYRVVWIRDLELLKKNRMKNISEADCDRLCEYLKSPNEGTLIIFSNEKTPGEQDNQRTEKASKLEKMLKSKAGCYELNSLDKKDLKSFIQKRFRASGIDISPALVSYMIDASGYYNKESDYNLYSLENDIFKIVSHCLQDSVSRNDIDELICADEETFVFNLLDAIGANDKSKAFMLLNNMIKDSPDNVFGIIAQIVSQFELMLTIRQMQNQNKVISEICKVTGKGEFRVKKLAGHARRYSVSELKEILISIYDTEKNIKSGLLKEQLALELFVAKI